MRLLMSVALVLAVTAGFAMAQAASPRQPAVKLSAKEEALARDKAHEAAVTDCEEMWDRGTHMSKQDWSRTCRRVQDRFRRYELK
jgi:hypothetical protein